MKVIVSIFLLIQFSAFAEVDTLSITDKTQLEIINGKEIFQSQSDWWDKYSSGLIAAITVFVSLGISVWQARVTQRQSRANSISEARIQWIQEVRPLLGKLIKETTKIAELIKELEQYYDKEKQSSRTNLSPAEAEHFDYIADEGLKLQDDFQSSFNQIKLFLNREETEHKDLLNTIEKFLENAKNEVRIKSFKNNNNAEDLILKAQVVLKNAWEQAKNQK